MKRTHWIPLAIFLGLIVLFTSGLKLNPRELPSALVGRPMPTFSLPQLSNPAKELNSEALHGPFLLNVWASWCGQCAREHPVLMGLQASGQLKIYGLNYKDSIAKAQAFLAKRGNPYTETALDLNGRVGMDYGVYGVPETYLIDEHGTVLFKHVGALTDEIVSSEILPLVKSRDDGAS